MKNVSSSSLYATESSFPIWYLILHLGLKSCSREIHCGSYYRKNNCKRTQTIMLQYQFSFCQDFPSSLIDSIDFRGWQSGWWREVLVGRNWMKRRGQRLQNVQSPCGSLRTMALLSFAFWHLLTKNHGLQMWKNTLKAGLIKNLSKLFVIIILLSIRMLILLWILWMRRKDNVFDMDFCLIWLDFHDKYRKCQCVTGI